MPWTPHSAIRSRREQLGLSQSDLANSLGVTKSLLSHIECGKRQPTDDQIEVLSTILSIPPDLLLLSGGRLPADIRDILPIKCRRCRGGGAAKELKTSLFLTLRSPTQSP